MNKLHVGATAIGVGYLAQLLAALFPHLSPNLVDLIAGGVPVVAMGLAAGIEVVFPKTKPVIEAVEGATKDQG